MKTFPTFLIASLLMMIAGALRAANEAGEAVLYDGGRTLPWGWTLDAWGGVVAEVDASAIGSVCIYPRSEAVQAWAGAWLHTIADTVPGLPLPGGREGAEPLYLNMQLIADRNEADGRFAVPLQVALSVRKADGTTGLTVYQGLRPYHMRRESTGDGVKWDLFSVPMEKLSVRQKTDILSIVGLHFQYASASPVLMGFHVGKVSISAVPYSSGAMP